MDAMRSLARTMGLGASLLLAATVGTGASAAAKDPPNIVFIIMDDVGIDQMKAFGYGGPTPARMPNFETIMKHGVAFTNVWAMPECSPSRAAFFSGRYPIRTGTDAAIVDNHLPQEYLSSFETTLPRILGQAGYKSSLIGKYHLGNDKDPAGDCAPQTRGWGNFKGNMTPGPPAIDVTAGGTDPNGKQVCGYDQSSDPGACYQQSGGDIGCGFIGAGSAAPGATPARTCLQKGGIFTARLSCGAAPPDASDFDLYNAYYVWPKFVQSGAKPPLATPACAPSETSRGYMSTVQSDNAADWWNRQDGPRMLTLSFNAMHTPFQKAPTTLVPDPTNQAATCNSGMPQRFLLNSILEGMDVEIGRFLANAGLAQLDRDGRVIAKLDLKNTMVVIVGDNGSFGTTVRVEDGFSAGRSKATVYQTGVWVPLIVAGPLVTAPGRSVDDLVNVVDLFNLFGAIAGVNVDAVVPTNHTLDAKPMLPYLTGTDSKPIRSTSYTQTGAGIFTPDPSERSYPCLIGSTCNDTQINNESLCKDNGGVWYGPGAATRATSCCAVAAQVSGGTVVPPGQYATRNKHYKLVKTVNTDCSAPLAPGEEGAFPWAEYKTKASLEFYKIAKNASNPIGIDNNDLLAGCQAGENPRSCLQSNVRGAYDQLVDAMDEVTSSARGQSNCAAAGDGNMDLWVNGQDVEDYRSFAGKGPSRYDINLDGVTDRADLAIIRANLGKSCMHRCRRADLNRDGVVNSADMTLLAANTGGCGGDKQVFCSGDLNGDARVNYLDVNLMTRAKNTCGSSDSSASLQ